MTVAWNILSYYYPFLSFLLATMNYIRGAVNAISAPYQYYKDLPPINPSTLTGAIDVIVIQRPTDDGDMELVCSPFHVRFGKWQVLRPGEKKVNVLVNGNPIPFNMKIGEAGEAFFVFETEDDVPADLITSPILQPTVPGDDTKETQEAVPVNIDRFGAKPDKDREEHLVAEDEFQSNAERDRTEPEFLDLDANVDEEVPPTPKQHFNVPSALRRSGSKATIVQSFLPPEREQELERRHTPEMSEQDQRADEALQSLRSRAHVPEVEYHHDVTLDMEGYKSGYHDHERSGHRMRSLLKFPRKEPVSETASRNAQSQTLARSNYSESVLPIEFSSKSPSSLSSPSPSPSPSGSESASPSFSNHIHSFRATSEPPPDLEIDSDAPNALMRPQQLGGLDASAASQAPVAYSWEWGAFPQPSPIKASFGKGDRIDPVQNKYAPRKCSRLSEKKGRFAGMRLPVDSDDSMCLVDELVRQQLETSKTGPVGRSRSVPPHFLVGPVSKGRRYSREYKEYEDVETEEGDDEEQEQRGRGLIWNEVSNGRGEILPQEIDSEGFGAGGMLSASRDDLTTFILKIEGRKLSFKLSLIPPEGEDALEEQKDAQREPSFLSEPTKEHDEIEAMRVFDDHCIDWSRFLEDESIINDPHLVIRWAGNQYITRNDGSPLMEALVRWRTTALAKRASGDILRPVSPPADGGYSDNVGDIRDRSHSGTPSSVNATENVSNNKVHDEGMPKKPASSSWSSWWSRGRQKDTTNEKSKQTSLHDHSSDNYSVLLPFPKGNEGYINKTKSASTTNVKADITPTTPPRHPSDSSIPNLSQDESEATPTRPAASAPNKKYAKTLRLTSEQLKSLNLKPGSNSITFSLSASGAIAATARIFVWEYTDLVVISDIDGTITKSDGLGHVFAMIGRDWTHLGVAKLYTDIVKNGYKIMYLTSRAIGQADATRDYLKGIKQNNYQLPEGPVIMSPDRLMASLHREVIMRKPEVFKMACLRDIQRLFGESARNPFYAGFGNRITDALSYRSVNVPSARIFTIDSSGEVKMELLELAGYKSSYIHMTDLVDQMFPPINRKWAPEFTDFNYWKPAMQDFPLPDFTPPSPALSARSDTSNQSALTRLRNFSLGGNSNTPSRPPTGKQFTVTSSIGEAGVEESPYRNSHLRQMSSFEKLTTTLGFMSKFNAENEHYRSISPSSSYVSDDDEDDVEMGGDEPRKRTRRRSMTSMPGTLEEQHFEFDDDDDKNSDRQFVHDDSDGGYEGEEHDDIEANIEEFDDDILAAGEMANVPFL